MNSLAVCPNPQCHCESTGRFCNRCGFDLTLVCCSTCGHCHANDYLSDVVPGCERCGAMLAQPLLLAFCVAQRAVDPGDLLFERFRIIEQLRPEQYLVLDTRPNLKRLAEPWAADSLAAAYRKLASVVGIPELLDMGSDSSAENGDWLLLAAPYGSKGLLLPLYDGWTSATASQRLVWLANWISLLEATMLAGYPGTALAPDNLRIAADDTLCMTTLLDVAVASDPVTALGKLWLDLMGCSDSANHIGSGFAPVELAKRAVAGAITIADLKHEIMLLCRESAMKIQHFGNTHVGCKRDNNEDNFLGWQIDLRQVTNSGLAASTRGLFVVCDGMGGHASGEIASQVAIATIRDRTLPLLLQEDFVAEDFAGNLRRLIREDVNSAIFELNEAETYSTLRRMGTTVVMVVIRDERAWWAHVGDSRLYQILPTGISQITEDHNIGTRDVKRGLATMLEAFRSPVGKHLTQALGPKSSEFVNPDVGEISLTEPCVLLLCSDGLPDMVPERDLASIAQKYWDDPESGVAELIRRANQGGGLDNITAILIRVEPPPPLFQSDLERSVAVN
ncbi:MAG: protein phosphatase 2C domain-containing protein [Cyanobacteria bacterium NC_groundwater_1444_Ag_S-0.65um_54_12]|nr:protein phosphatase 2C domain-containing protein [Cyanobacteria bacterium NC_groundwater_1444_Ag_S-0.65um_54_12]